MNSLTVVVKNEPLGKKIEKGQKEQEQGTEKIEPEQCAKN
jgi:hypothetical protein